MNRWSIRLLLFLLVVGGEVASGATYYVRAQGNDEASGRYPSQAWRSIRRAARVAKGGDTILVGPGQYEGKLRFAVEETGAESIAGGVISVVADRRGGARPDVGEVIVESAGSWTVCCDSATEVRLIGLTIRAPQGIGVWARQATSVRLEDCQIRECVAGVRAEQTAWVQVARCVLRDCQEHGVLLTKGTYGEIDDCQILRGLGHGVAAGNGGGSLKLRRTRIVANRGTAVICRGPAELQNCLLDGNHVGVEMDSDGVRLVHLTIANSRSHGIVHEHGGEVAVINSAITGNGGVGILSRVGQMALVSNHLHRNRGEDYQGLPLENDGKTRDPGYVGDGDFTPERESPLLNAGVPTELLVDLDGHPRQVGTAPDMGCLERTLPVAAIYYVRPDGSDSWGGTSPKSAWKTIAHAARQAGAGATIYVGGGVYEEDVVSGARGSDDSPIVFIADLTGAKTGVRGEVVLRPSSAAWAWQLHGASHTRICGFVIQPGAQHASGGVRVEGCHEVELRDCQLRGTAHGVFAEASSIALRRCEGKDIAGQAVTISNGQLTLDKCRLWKGGIGAVCLPGAVLVGVDTEVRGNSVAGIQNAGRLDLDNCLLQGNDGASVALEGIDDSQIHWRKLAIRDSNGYAFSLSNCSLKWEQELAEECALAGNAGGIVLRNGGLRLGHWDLSKTTRQGLAVESGSLDLSDSKVSGGVSCIQVYRSQVRLDRCHFDGGDTGIAVEARESSVDCRNSLVPRCGTLLRLLPGQMSNEARVWNCTAARCHRVGVDASSGHVELHNCILVGATEGALSASLTPESRWVHSHNLWSGFRPDMAWELGAGEHWGSPRFAAPERGDYQLGVGSPAINAGRESPNVEDRDLLGKPRPQFRAWDLGAYEFLGGNGSLRILRWEESK